MPCARQAPSCLAPRRSCGPLPGRGANPDRPPCRAARRARTARASIHARPDSGGGRAVGGGPALRALRSCGSSWLPPDGEHRAPRRRDRPRARRLAARDRALRVARRGARRARDRRAPRRTARLTRHGLDDDGRSDLARGVRALVGSARRGRRTRACGVRRLPRQLRPRRGDRGHTKQAPRDRGGTRAARAVVAPARVRTPRATGGAPVCAASKRSGLRGRSAHARRAGDHRAPPRRALRRGGGEGRRHDGGIDASSRRARARS